LCTHLVFCQYLNVDIYIVCKVISPVSETVPEPTVDEADVTAKETEEEESVAAEDDNVKASWEDEDEDDDVKDNWDESSEEEAEG